MNALRALRALIAALTRFGSDLFFGAGGVESLADVETGQIGSHNRLCFRVLTFLEK